MPVPIKNVISIFIFQKLKMKKKKKKNDHISISIVNDIHQVNIQQPLRTFFFNEKKEPIRIVDIHVADYFFHDDVSPTSKF